MCITENVVIRRYKKEGGKATLQNVVSIKKSLERIP